MVLNSAAVPLPFRGGNTSNEKRCFPLLSCFRISVTFIVIKEVRGEKQEVRGKRLVLFSLHTPHSTFHIPHSSLHIPHSTFHIPHFFGKGTNKRAQSKIKTCFSFVLSSGSTFGVARGTNFSSFYNILRGKEFIKRNLIRESNIILLICNKIKLVARPTLFQS